MTIMEVEGRRRGRPKRRWRDNTEEDLSSKGLMMDEVMTRY